MPIPNLDALTRIGQLEKKLEHIEKDADWDALAPEIADVERALTAKLTAEQAALATQRSAFIRGHGMFARLFSPSARGEYKDTVVATESELDKTQGGAHRLHQLKAKFYDDKMRAHAREFIRVATKVQKNVGGDWEDKALTASARWLTGATGDEALDFVKAFRTATATSSNAITPDVTLAGQLSLASPDAAARTAIALAAASGSPSLAGVTLAAAVYAMRGAGDARAVVTALAGTGALPKGDDARALLCAAALLSKAPASSSAHVLAKMSGAVSGMWDGAEPVIAAAMLMGIDPLVAVDFANRAAKLLSGAEGAASIIAAGLMSRRSVEDTVATAKEIEGKVAGTLKARASIAAAGVLSGRPAGEVIAFAKHVQSQLAGTWESEATIICAGILGAPGKAASDVVRRAFLLPGVVRPVDEE